MHLYMITRGIKNEVDQFITELQGKYLPFKWRDANKGDKQVVDAYTQIAVRPIQLWELVFPEGSKDIVLATIFKKDKGLPQHKWHQKFVWALRKMLGMGVEPIPEYKTNEVMPIRCEGIERIGIGVKKDYWITKDGKHVAEWEEGAFEGL